MWNSADPFSEASNLLSMVEKSQVVSYTKSAAFAWLFWDWLIQLDDEVKLVWHRKLSVSKVLYICTRYLGLALITFERMAELKGWSIEFCKSYFYAIGLGSYFLILVVDIGMQFRIYALYECSKLLLGINVTLFLMEAATIWTLIILDYIQRNQPVSTPDFHGLLTGCWNIERPKYSFVTWFIALAFELYLFILVSYIAYGKYERLGAIMGIFGVMFRDAVVWFLFIAAILAWNAFSWVNGDTGYVFLALPFFHAGVCIGGSRLILNLIQATVESEDTSLGLDRLTDYHRAENQGGHELRMIPGSTQESNTRATNVPGLLSSSLASVPQSDTKRVSDLGSHSSTLLNLGPEGGSQKHYSMSSRDDITLTDWDRDDCGVGVRTDSV
ncbi:hypothetical protein FRC03_003580 [Tulasnella sp. 419]|nr:hypothetical protein FRC02_001407 [Tulasnella sp. 418]KAG8962963.1 hypothetical protein FRC03_003580 [Tulasnella sp. 419]